MPELDPQGSVAAPASSSVAATDAALPRRDPPTAPIFTGSGGTGGNLPPVSTKRTAAPNYDGRTLFIIAAPLDQCFEFEAGVLTSLASTPVTLPSEGYLVEVFGPLTAEVATRLQFRAKGQALNAFEGVCVDGIAVAPGSSLILLLAQSDEGNRVYPVRAHQVAAPYVIREVLQPEREF